MRLIIGLLMATSIAFACDQPYEEVGGYKIGCPFENTSEFELIDTIDSIDMKRYTKDISGVFDSVTIDTLNGEIAWVGFLSERNKPYPTKDTQDIIKSLENRWGNFSEDNGGFVNQPDNALISEIRFYASSNPDDNIMMLMYTSNKMTKAEEKLEKIEALERKEELSKF